jgi:hypothetical protein
MSNAPDTRETVELKPCPFCGGSPERFTEDDGAYHGVRCAKCDIGQTNAYVEEDFATEAWNTRAAPVGGGEYVTVKRSVLEGVIHEADRATNPFIALKAALAAAPLAPERAGRVLLFRDGSEIPDVRKGSYETFIVVTENADGKHFCFPADYLNAFPLEYSECQCKGEEEHGEGCPTTGWFYNNSNYEYEDCFHPISARLLRWAPIPKAAEVLSPSPAHTGEELVRALQRGIAYASGFLKLYGHKDGIGPANPDAVREEIESMQRTLSALTIASQGKDGPLNGKYGDVLRPFVAMMEKELHANAGKGDRPGWLEMDGKTGLLEIFYHLSKLQKAVKDGNPDGIREYAADVANMSMMLVDICGQLDVLPLSPKED